jgi:high-affinity nickel-transport protein
VALIASRVMGLVVSGVSLLVAAFGAAKLLSPTVDAWSDGKELVFGAALLVAIIAASSFVFAVRLTRQPKPRGLRRQPGEGKSRPAQPAALLPHCQ